LVLFNEIKMNTLKILTIKEKQNIINKLKNQFGISYIKGIFVKRGTERLFLFTGSFTVQQIMQLENSLPIERVGIYFGKEQNEKIRLSLEGVHLLKNQITKNIFELNKEQAEQWMKGHELYIQTRKNDFLIMKYKEDFLGCGKASAEKIGNYVSKNRRLKEGDILD